MVDLHVERRVEGASRRKLRVTAWVMSCNRRSAGVGVRKWVQIQCFELEVTVYTQMEMIKRQLETWALGQGWVHLQLGIWEFEFEIWVWDWKKSLSSSSEVKARHGARVDSLFGHRYVRGVRNAGPDFWKTLVLASTSCLFVATAEPLVLREVGASIQQIQSSDILSEANSIVSLFHWDRIIPVPFPPPWWHLFFFLSQHVRLRTVHDSAWPPLLVPAALVVSLWGFGFQSFMSSSSLCSESLHFQLPQFSCFVFLSMWGS